MPGLARIPTSSSSVDSIIFNGLHILSDGVFDRSVHILDDIVYLEELHSLDTFGISAPTCKTSISSPKTLRTSPYTSDTSLSEATPVASSLSSARPLIDPVTLSNEMTTVSRPYVQCSPPGLTHSRSSSRCTSSLSASDATLPDLNHFEDISLTKDSQLDDQDRYSNGPAAHLLPTMKGGTGDPTTFLRDLTVSGVSSAARNSHVQGGRALGLGPVHALTMPNGSSLTRKFSTSSGLARRAMSNHSRSRSPSPSGAPFLFSSPQSPPLAPSRDAFSPPMRASTTRRGSRQPNRKTAKELEDEYDDTDEDLPDDASLWNVPLSPRTSTGDMKNVIGSSAKTMPMSISPERLSADAGSLQLQKPVHSASHVICPVISIPASGGIDSTAESPHENYRRVSSRSRSRNYSPPKSRAKSWTAAMSELSQDAQKLTEALQGMVDSSAVNNETSNPKAGSNDHHGIKMSVDLPPLRIHNVMIDPLPISKEKERVLSRTRPSWLPPKSQKEERKHLKEYQRMMESSLQAGMILPITKV